MTAIRHSFILTLLSACGPTDGLYDEIEIGTITNAGEVGASDAARAPERPDEASNDGEGGADAQIPPSSVTGVTTQTCSMNDDGTEMSCSVSVSIDVYPYTDYALAPSSFPDCLDLATKPMYTDVDLLAVAALTNKIHFLPDYDIDMDGDGTADSDIFDNLCYTYDTLPKAPPPPPFGATHTGVIDCTTAFNASNPPGGHSSTVFTIANTNNSIVHRLNRTQNIANPTINGCWFEVGMVPGTGADPNLMWAAVLYGMVNYGTPSAISFTNQDGAYLDALVYRMSYRVEGVPSDIATFEAFLADVHNIGDPGNATLVIQSIDYAIGGTPYSYPSNPHIWPAGNSTYQIALNTSPLGIIDPESEDDVDAFFQFADWAESNITLVFE
ncbi:MAG: hypothetical protein AAFV53_10450 [Myxococcota bacterium]